MTEAAPASAPSASEPSNERLEAYLSELFGTPVRVSGRSSLHETVVSGATKAFGYGHPVRIDLEMEGGPRSLVLETAKPGRFGHEHSADRAQMMLWNHAAYNTLPRHVRALDVGAFDEQGNPFSVRHAQEFFLLVEHVPGEAYIRDLARLQDGAPLRDLDLGRARVLAEYLAGVHAVKRQDPGLYDRRLRELLGHGEAVMGICDSYPLPCGFIDAGLLEEIERRILAWRWRLKQRTHRLCQVHGDFHPYNLLFREAEDFTVLDRSRGEWGEAADDLTALSANYLFCSLQAHGSLTGSLERLFRHFWDCYLERTGDEETLEAAAPFFAFRCLVLASPVWYPDLAESVRRQLFAFLLNLLEAPRFDPARVNGWLHGV